MPDVRIIEGVPFRRYKPPGQQRNVYLADGGKEGYVQAWDVNMISEGQLAGLFLWETEGNLQSPKTPHLDFDK